MEQTSESFAAPVRWRTFAYVVCALVCCLVAHAPLLHWHGQELWRRPHYQFYPLALVAAAFLAWTRWPDTYRPGSSLINLLLALMAWTLLAAAVVGGSPWLGAIASILALVALLHGVGGGALLVALGPTLVLLLVTIHPPLGLDHELIVWLRRLATGVSSNVLDLMNVAHVAAGNVIETERGRLMVEDACSGINSLLSVLTCVLFYVFLTRRGWAHSFLLLSASAGWVLVANAVRVVVVTYSAAVGGPPLAEGWPHEALGLGLFVVCLVLTLSTDRLLLFFFLPPPMHDLITLPPVDPGAEPGIPEPSCQPEQPVLPEPKVQARPWLLSPAALMGYLALLVLNLALTPLGTVLDLDAPLFRSIARVQEDTVSPALSGWQRADFEDRARGTGSPLGEFSKRWTFRRGEELAVLSLDYPFGEWHELGLCYVAQGWFVDQHVEGEGSAGWVVMRLVKPAGRSGLVLFCNLTGSGELVDPGGWTHDTSPAGRLSNRASRILLSPFASYRRIGPLAQLQVKSEWEGPGNAKREQQQRDLFLAGRAAIQQAMSAQGGNSHAAK